MPGKFLVSWVENSILLTRKKVPLRTPRIQGWGTREIWVKERQRYLSPFRKECQNLLNIERKYSRKEEKHRKDLANKNNSIANIYILLTARTVPDAKKEAVCTGDGFSPRI